MSGTVAKTVIAPADRIKILFQTSDRTFSLGKALSDLEVEFEVPEDVPILGISAGLIS